MEWNGIVAPSAQTQLKFMAVGAKAEAGVEGSRGGEKGETAGRRGGGVWRRGGTKSVLIKSKAAPCHGLPVKVCILWRRLISSHCILIKSLSLQYKRIVDIRGNLRPKNWPHTLITLVTSLIFFQMILEVNVLKRSFSFAGCLPTNSWNLGLLNGSLQKAPPSLCFQLSYVLTSQPILPILPASADYPVLHQQSNKQCGFVEGIVQNHGVVIL